MQLNLLTDAIIGAAIDVHRELGPGLLESVYQACLVLELRNRGFVVGAEIPLPVHYRGHVVHNEGFRVDLLVDDRIVVELKSVEKVLPVHLKQLLTYLRLASKPIGLLINFNVPLLKDGIQRVINSEHTKYNCFSP